jgi:glutamate/tyrosine decarboxylase-like PLP-dependent enzyme
MINAMDAIHSDRDFSNLLSLNAEDRELLIQKVRDYYVQFLDRLPDGKAYYGDKDAGKGLASMPFREDPYTLHQIFDIFHQSVTENGINPASGKHFGYVPGGGIETAAWGDFLGAVTNRYSGVNFANPGAVRMENQVIRWMCNMVGFGERSHGSLLSGGSIANLTGIIVARDYKELKARDYDKAVIYLTAETHHCVQKALRLAGMGESIIRYVAMDEQFCMKPEALELAIEQDLAFGFIPFLLIGSAGTTNTGAIDPLERLAEIASRYKLWFHVDAAYGGFFLLVHEMKHRFRGIECADSVVMDPHKSLFMPYGSGVILVREAEQLYNANHYTAAYLQDFIEGQEERSPADYSPELTRHFRGMRIWFSLQILGISPFREALAEKIRLSQYFHREIQKAGFDVGPYPALSISLFRYVPPTGNANEANARLLSMIHEDGQIFVSSTTIEDILWIRMAILVFRAHQKEVDFAIIHLQKLKKEMIIDETLGKDH